MSLPEYLTNYTKNSFDLYTCTRNKALSLRASEVGISQTSRETGWSMPVISNACKENGITELHAGRRLNKPETKPESPDPEKSVQVPKILEKSDPPKSPKILEKSHQVEMADILSESVETSPNHSEKVVW